MPAQIGWSQESKLLYNILQQIKKASKVAGNLTTTTTTTTSP